MFWKVSVKQFTIFNSFPKTFIFPPANSPASEREFTIAGMITNN